MQTDPTGLLIQNVNILQTPVIETSNVQIKELIFTFSDVPKTASNDGLDVINSEVENTNMASESSTDDQVEQISKESLESDQHDNAKKNTGIETVVESLSEALNEDEAPNTEQEKEKIITQYHHDDAIVDLEINDWLNVDSWGKTPAIEEMILVDFGDL